MEESKTFMSNFENTQWSKLKHSISHLKKKNTLVGKIENGIKTFSGAPMPPLHWFTSDWTLATTFFSLQLAINLKKKREKVSRCELNAKLERTCSSQLENLKSGYSWVYWTYIWIVLEKLVNAPCKNAQKIQHTKERVVVGGRGLMMISWWPLRPLWLHSLSWLSVLACSWSSWDTQWDSTLCPQEHEHFYRLNFYQKLKKYKKTTSEM